MKLLTLNTHSLIEENYPVKLQQFVDFILAEQLDVIALQEVNQSIHAQEIGKIPLPGYVPCSGNRVPLRTDNHALSVATMLRSRGLPYCWSWLPAKVGYEKYDEGMAIFSRKPIQNTDNLLISQSDNYAYWKTRRVLGVQVENAWYYSIHMGWWNDQEEPFKDQWSILNAHARAKNNVWLLGDFNSDAAVAGEGYDLIRSSGWQDTYELAAIKDEGYTVAEPIDGWRDSQDPVNTRRIDYIWHDTPLPIADSKVVFNGVHSPQVSDHFGILLSVCNCAPSLR